MLTRQVIGFLGFMFALIVLLVVCFFAMFFVFPQMEFFGVTSVSQRDSYMTYFGDEVKAILNHRNIIIESQNVDVEIRVRKEGQLDEGTIQVWQDINGLSFNSLKHVKIDWVQVVLDSGEIYYKIIISEPKGMLSSRARVYLNLYPNDAASVTEEWRNPYNFIFNTRSSDVEFAADNAEIEYLYVDKVTVNDAKGRISFPTPTESEPFFVDVGTLEVNSSVASVYCKSDIRRDVVINSDYGSFTLGNVGKAGEGEQFGRVTAIGKSNSITVDEVLGDVILRGESGRLYQGSGAILGDLYFECDSGEVNIREARDIKAQTKYGAVKAGKCRNFDFESSQTGGCVVNEVWGVSSVKTLYGATSLYNVRGDVEVDSRYGRVFVEFDSKIDVDTGSAVVSFPSVVVYGYDGDIDVKNICGKTDISVDAGGKAIISASFRQVIGPNQIWYKGSSKPNQNYGNISVTFINSIQPCNLKVEATAGARNRSFSNVNLALDAEFKNQTTYFVNGGNGNHFLNIITSNKFELWGSN